MPWPRIVAEALERIDDRAQIAGRCARCAPLTAVVDAINAARAPARSALEPPRFLRPHQLNPWRRALAALDAWNAALVLESVGAGKTWIALGVAALEPGRVVAIVPAILRDQWQDASARVGVPLCLWTHERASRGGVPPVRPSLVIIDEAHRFRDPATRRVHTIAPWLVGRRTLLLTATPIVNRLGDLVALLRLVLADDALALDGIAKLTDLERGMNPPAGLRRVAIRSVAPAGTAVDRRVTLLQPDRQERSRAERAVAAISRLELSAHAGTHRLLRSVLLDGAASSDAAFHQTLARYRALLLQSRDAGGVSRAMLRHFAGPSLDQLVFWPLVADGPAATDLPIADIARVEQLLATVPNDGPWIRELAAKCDDARPTICFTRHRATARQLRLALGDDAAWVTGSAAGIGPHRVLRGALLAAFGPGRAACRIRRKLPRILVATDVAAEGLDLQSAGRVVHVDLPWTATRIEQREGRLLRLGQHYPDVEVVVRVPSPAIEAALEPQARVHRKRRLADEWTRALEATDGASGAPANSPLVTGVTDGRGDADLVAVRLQRDRRTGVVLMTRTPGGPWHVDERSATALIDRVRAGPLLMMDSASVSNILADAAHAAVAACTPVDGAAPALVRRIHRLARQAAARRDAEALTRLDRLLRFVSTPATTGGRDIAAELQQLSDRAFSCRELPEMPRRGAIRATAIAAVCIRSSGSP